jgi:large subunit ribosomal protein L22
MQNTAISKNIRISPYKLRPIADVIRGKTLAESKAYLTTYATQRVKPIMKTLDSAYANARNLDANAPSEENFLVKTIFVDQGPIIKYFKPAAQGRAAAQRKRLSIITVTLEVSKKIAKKA